MLAHSTLTLPAGAVFDGPWLAHPHLREAEQADQVLARAEAEARRLVDAAAVQAEQAIQAATTRFWAQAEQALAALAAQRQAIEDHCVDVLAPVLGEVLATVLGECTPDDRWRALIRQLARRYSPAKPARLRCPALQVCEVAEALSTTEQAAHWELVVDEQLPHDTLLLDLPDIQITVAWGHLKAALGEC